MGSHPKGGAEKVKLTKEGLQNTSWWKEHAYVLPSYDREKMIQKTKENPYWIHFGASNIFRIFQARLAEDLLNKGIMDRGIVVAEGFDYELVETVLHPHDNYSVAVTLKADGFMEKQVIGSIAETLLLDSENKVEFDRLKEIFSKESLQLATFTITEKGYSLVNASGEVLPQVKADFAQGPGNPSSYMGKVTALLYHRYLAGEKKIAMVSNDNCSHNGDKLAAAIGAFAKNWAEAGLVEAGFVSYVEDKSKVSFPWTMIDKITPRPDTLVMNSLIADGLEDVSCLVTGKNTYVAPFVNAEECEYLVIEDAFPNGRPPLEHAGVIFTKKETVDQVEKMKVCTCLNPLHTALAIFGCLLGYDKISEEMKDADLVNLVKKIGYEEGLPVVVNPGILDPKEFIDTVLNVRIPNPFMPDTPQRIATDTSQKLAIRFGETIKAYEKKCPGSSKTLQGISLVFAGFIRYLMGIDDNGQAFTLSPDPLMEELLPYVSSLTLGNTSDVENAVGSLLENESIFGVNLSELGMKEQVLLYLKEMLKGVGAVRDTLSFNLEK